MDRLSLAPDGENLQVVALAEIQLFERPARDRGTWSDDRLDHGLIVDRLSGRRYLVALALPWATTDNDDAQELTREALVAIR